MVALLHQTRLCPCTVASRDLYAHIFQCKNSRDLKFVYSFSQSFAQETMAPSDMSSILMYIFCLFVYLNIYLIYLYIYLYLFMLLFIFFITTCGEQPGIEFSICCLVALLRYQFAQDWTHLHCPPTTSMADELAAACCCLAVASAPETVWSLGPRGVTCCHGAFLKFFWESLRRLTMSSYKRCGGNQIPNQRMSDKTHRSHVWHII